MISIAAQRDPSKPHQVQQENPNAPEQLAVPSRRCEHSRASFPHSSLLLQHLVNLLRREPAKRVALRRLLSDERLDLCRREAFEGVVLVLVGHKRLAAQRVVNLREERQVKKGGHVREKSGRKRARRARDFMSTGFSFFFCFGLSASWPCHLPVVALL